MTEQSAANRSLTDADRKLIEEFRTRKQARHPAPRLKVRHKPPKPVELAPADGEPDTALQARLAAFGTSSNDFFSRTLLELLEAGCRGGNSVAFGEADVNGTLAAMHGIAPRDEIEGMLAAQMVATHSAAMRCLRQCKGSDTIPQQDSNGNLAVKLLRTYTMQIEALQRYRGKGQQTVRVEHVTVQAGGQAIVGNVTGGTGGKANSEGQPHAKQLTHAPGETLPSEIQAQRAKMPVTSG